MNEESVYDGDGIDGADEEDFIITNLDSVHDLDDAFRPDEIYLARWPFKVHSPRSPQWTWGYRLEQVGNHLIFQDGSELGRTVMSDSMSMRASDDGSIIWFFGFEDDGLTVLTLSTATIDDYRAAAPEGIAIESFADGARVVMAELETRRRAKFGLDFECVLASRFAVVFRACPGTPVQGVFYFSQLGNVYARHDRRWVKSTFSEDGAVLCDDELLLSPILKSGIAFSETFSETDGTLTLERPRPYIYPKFDIDGPESWRDLYADDDWEIVD